jgi:hypothetical protein
MRFAANNHMPAVLLIIILSVYGWKETRDMIILDKTRAILEGLTNQNKMMRVSELDGVDTDGQQIKAIVKKQRKTLAFVLHSDTLTNDLEFWNDTANLLASQTDVGIIGFCDSRQCDQALMGYAKRAFPVASYGEVMDVEALINADAEGKAILSINGKADAERIAWRFGASSPGGIAKELMR